VTSMIENERWRTADRAADLLSVDREVCRRAFYREPEERVREVVQWVLSERDLPEHDPERMIERWALEHGAGVYSRDRRRGGLEQVEGIVTRALFGRDTAA
jgi:predicted nuclease of restriction endonuclease-like RecB superfamily